MSIQLLSAESAKVPIETGVGVAKKGDGNRKEREIMLLGSRGKDEGKKPKQ